LIAGKGIQGDTRESYKELQGVAGSYRELQDVSSNGDRVVA
jgi:hypothetical protein